MKHVIIYMLLFSLFGHSQEPKKQLWFDSMEIKKHVLTLSSDSFQGRQPFTAGETKTIDYLTKAFQKMKLDPGNRKSYLQEVTIVQYHTRPAASILLSGGLQPLVLELGKDYAITSTGPDSVVSLEKAEVVFVGYGIVAPQYERNDYKGIDAKGKVVLVLMNERNTKESFLKKGISPTYFETVQYKFEEAARQGAKACFLVQPPGATDLNRVQSAINENKLGLDQSGQCSVTGLISRATVKKIFTASSYDTNLIETALERSFRPTYLNVQVSTSIQVSKTFKKTWNVLAIIPGVKKPDECVIFSAHWDHLGIGKPDSKGDSIYNGASDNALGIAVLLELARKYATNKLKPDRTIMFLCTAAEEEGFFGSLWYTLHPLWPLDKTVANINIDGFNRFGKTTDIVMNGSGRSELEDLLKDQTTLQKRIPRSDPEPAEAYYFRSDNISFANAGIPALFLSRGTDYVTGGTDYEKTVREKYYAYHSPSDEYNEGWRFDGTIEDMKLFYELGLKLATAGIWPKWKSDSEFQRRGSN